MAHDHDGALKLYQRLEAFRHAHKLTDEQMSDALGTSIHTYRTWKYRKSTPPAAAAQLLSLLEREPRVRTLLGVRRARKRPRGYGFQPGNPWRVNDPRRQEAIAEARAKREQSGANAPKKLGDSIKDRQR